MPKQADPNRVIWNADVKQMLEQGYDAYQAFEALCRALSSAPETDVVKTLVDGELAETEKPSQVYVDYRALVTLVSGWKEYKERSPEVSLGNVYGLEGGKGGAERGVGRFERLDQRITYAVHVAQLVEREGISMAAAIRQIAENSN